MNILQKIRKKIKRHKKYTKKKMERQTTQVKSSGGVAIEELKHSRIEGLNSRINKNNLLFYNAQITDLAFSQENERARFAERLAGLEVELARMRDILTKEIKSEETRVSHPFKDGKRIRA